LFKQFHAQCYTCKNYERTGTAGSDGTFLISVIVMTLTFSTPTSSQGQEGMMLTAGIPDQDEMAVSKMYNMSAPQN